MMSDVGAPDHRDPAVPIVAPSAHPWSAAGGDVGVLLLHGFTGNPTSMRPLAEHLAGAGLAIELPRLPGHGTHWKDLARTSWQDWAREAASALDRLRTRASVVAVVGMSAGGALALHLAQTRGRDVDAIVLINPSVTFRHPLKPVAGIVARVLPTFPGIGNDIARPGADELPYDRVPVRAAASLFALQDQVRANLAAVHAPTLVLTSRADHTVATGDSTLVLDGIGSARREHVWLERSFHVATLDYDADVIADRTLAFVREHAAAGGQISDRGADI
jgi:carboxylesterase